MHQLKFRVRRIAASLIVTGATFLGAGIAQAQDGFPDHSIRLIVPFSPGGQTDIVSRQIGEKLTPIIGQQLIIDNRGGAAGMIGSTEAARAKPDGYTLVVATSSSHAINPTAMANIAYDAVKDFAPITVIGTGPMAISVHPSVPAQNLKALIAEVKKHPTEYSYGSSGVGGINHLAGELLKQKTGIRMVHVPYKGSGASLLDLVGGYVPVVVSTLSSALPHHTQGRIRTLAVASQERSRGAPKIPTTQEAGAPGVIAYTFNILLAPAGTPRSVVDYLSAAMTKVMNDDALTNALIRLGVDPIRGSSPEKAAAMIEAEIAKWAPLIKTLKLRK